MDSKDVIYFFQITVRNDCYPHKKANAYTLPYNIFLNLFVIEKQQYF